MKMYVNWYSQEIITKKEFDESIIEMLNDDITFSDFLEYQYTYLELFEMENKNRLLLFEEFIKWAMEHTELGNFEEVEIEVGFPEGAVLLVPKK